MIQKSLHDIGMTLVYGVEESIVPRFRWLLDVDSVSEEDVHDSDVATEFAHIVAALTSSPKSGGRASERMHEIEGFRVVMAVAGEDQRGGPHPRSDGGVGALSDQVLDDLSVAVDAS